MSVLGNFSKLTSFPSLNSSTGSWGHGPLTSDLGLYSTSLNGYAGSEGATEFLLHLLTYVTHFTLGLQKLFEDRSYLFEHNTTVA